MVEYLLPPAPGEDVVLVAYDEAWPATYARQESRIRSALGETVVDVQHAGSTSVPGLTAKPVIDIVLVVPDPDDEADYVPALEATGYVLHLREPEWHEHRLLREGEGQRVNLHVFGPGCEEVARMLAFRDHLRRDESDRALYERTKQELAGRTWAKVQDYADAKSGVVTDIMGRALR
ncbi:GrpB family protein [Nocardioides sp. GXQ0305]|uniref:GrpB family protein n=1 Tax=Nocardioides sp. GXQ0305 TaxID=3423912 RepID=UPI003D7EACAB